MAGIASQSLLSTRRQRRQQTCTGKRVTRLALLALVVGGQSSYLFAQARPFDTPSSAVAAGKARALDPQTTQAAAMSRNAQPDRLQDIVSAFVEEQAHKGQPRSVGYVGVHPLPRANADEVVTAEKRQAALPNIIPAAAQPASSSAAAAPATTAAPASSKPPAASSAPASSQAASSSATAPTIMPASKSSDSSSSSSASPTSTNEPDSNDVNSNGIAAFFSPHNKMFPLAIALTVVMGLGVLLVLVSIGKCYSHRQMARELRDGKRQPKTKDSSVLTSANGFKDYNNGSSGGAMERTRTLGKSLRRALTRGKLGGNSFARRNREGTVLIDVGDEVFAVSTEVAREYERERKSVLSGSGGSRLTCPSNQPTPLRQALYNAQLIVAASQAEQARGKPQAPRGFDINQWRSSSATDDDEHRLYGTDDKNAFSFDTEKQMHGDMRQAHAPLSATVPVLTRGSGAWAIQRQQGGDDLDERPPPPLRMLKSNSSDSTLRDSALAHDRVALHDEGPARAGGVVVNNVARNGAQRPKSILIKRSQEQLRAQQKQQAAVNAYRQRDNGRQQQQLVGQPPRRADRASSTAPGSPKMLQQRMSGTNLRGAAAAGRTAAAAGPYNGAGAKNAGARKAPLVLNPETPARSHGDNRRANGNNGSGSDASSNESRDLFRPLPMPPSLSPITGDKVVTK